MFNYDYMETIKEDIRDYIREHADYIKEGIEKKGYTNDMDGLQEYLHDTLWTCDAVTGNGSGSYTFNSYTAREYVTDNMEICKEAIREFCMEAETIAEWFLEERWEDMDVTIRCYLLPGAISEVLEEMEGNTITIDGEGFILFPAETEEAEEVA